MLVDDVSVQFEVVAFSGSSLYGEAVIDWLSERRDELPGLLVLVPTAQSGRLLREGLAERGGYLSPKVMTPGGFLANTEGAPDAVERLAWVEVLERVEEWEKYEAIFPESPAVGGPGWSLGLAKSLVGLRRELQEAGLTIKSASNKVPGIVRDRWQQLTNLEYDVEVLLKNWGYPSRSHELASGRLVLPAGVTQVVVAGVMDLPPVVGRFFESGSLPVTALVPHDGVDAYGRPTLEWSERKIAWPGSGDVSLTGDPRQQADLAVIRVMEAGSQSDEVSLGTADEEVSAELVRSFGRAGWIAHDPGAVLPLPLMGWLGAWRAFLQNAGVAEAIDLLAFEPSRSMIQGLRSQQVDALSALRDSHLIRSLDDSKRALASLQRDLERATRESTAKRLEFQVGLAGVAAETMEDLVKLRGQFLAGGFHEGMKRWLKWLDPDGSAGLEQWLLATEEASQEVSRAPGFWIELLLQDLGPVTEEGPDGRVLDVQGWLELLHARGSHLIICGMNEGRVPSRASRDPWLTETLREELGLMCDKRRASRDAYLLSALIEMRRESGRVDLLVGKSSRGGDVLMPSRLLLTAEGSTLAERVSTLFAEVEPEDAGVQWEMEERWMWKVPQKEAKPRLSVTAFSKYLACPFRYYLERVLGMSASEPERAEWNHRDFGNVLHAVLEQWGKDKKARDSADEIEIKNWLLASLDALIEQQFGKDLPLVISLQRESMRLRLGWFASRQAECRADGWRIIEVEQDFKLELGGMTVTGQIDRVERNDDGRIRVVDYKSSRKAKEVVGQHQKKFRGEVPSHLQHDEVMTPDGKVWTNLQVPLYAVAYRQAHGRVDEVGYFAVGEDEANVGVTPWPDFSDEVGESAIRCAEWVIARVQAGQFWPPAEKVTYEDFPTLACGREITETVKWEEVKP